MLSLFLFCSALSCPYLILHSIFLFVFFALLSAQYPFYFELHEDYPYPFLTSLNIILFQQSVGTIEDSSQLNFIYRGFVRLLNNVHLSESSYLPFSVARMSVEQVGKEELLAGDF